MRPATRVLGPSLLAALTAACFSDGGQHQPGGTSSTGATECEPRRVSLELSQPKVVLALDKSSSMSSLAWDHDGDPNTPDTTRWPVLHAVVSTIPAAIYTTVELGLTLLPSRGATGEQPETLCRVASTVEVPTQLWGRDEVVEAMPAAGASVNGMTPIDAGLQAASVHLSGFDAKTPRAVLLVADGAANCQAGVDGVQSGEVFDDGAVATAQAAFAAGIRTFVVGLAIPPGPTPVADGDAIPDGIDTFATLQDLAVAGGTAAAYDAQSQAQLQAAFDEILGRRLLCDGLAPPRQAGEQVVGVTLEADAVALPYTVLCGDAPGWRFSDGSNSAVKLCGPTCDAFKAEPTVYFDLACGR